MFGILAFALSSVLSAAAAFVIVFEGAPIEAFQVHFVTVLIGTEVVFLGPRHVLPGPDPSQTGLDASVQPVGTSLQSGLSREVD